MKQILAVIIALLLVPGAAAQTGLDVGPGLLGPGSPIYGLEVAWDSAAMDLGLKNAGNVAQERAAEARQAQENGNHEAAERAVREMEGVTERATENDSEGLQKAAAVLQEVMQNAPEEARPGIQNALQAVSRAAEQGAPANTSLGELCSSREECVTYCASNRQECVSYCQDNPDNDLCRTMQNQGPGGNTDSPAGTTDVGGMGDLCGSSQDCMSYCQNNLQDCMSYCMDNPDNPICQQLRQTGSGGPRGGSAESPAGSGEGYEPGATWDLEENGVPQFMTHSMFDLDYLVNEAGLKGISYFRSGYGHDNSGDLETCRSMKHYYTRSVPPEKDLKVAIYSPVEGRIQQIEDKDGDRKDTRINILVKNYSAFEVGFHHTNPVESLEKGDEIQPGDLLAYQKESRTLAEPYVHVFVPGEDGAEKETYVSPFETMTDEVFDRYRQFGAESPQDFIITREYRDNHPLECEDDGHGTGDFTGNTPPDDENFFAINSESFSFDG